MINNKFIVRYLHNLNLKDTTNALLNSTRETNMSTKIYLKMSVGRAAGLALVNKMSLVQGKAR